MNPSMLTLSGWVFVAIVLGATLIFIIDVAALNGGAANVRSWPRMIAKSAYSLYSNALVLGLAWAWVAWLMTPS